MTTNGNHGKRCKHIKANGQQCLAWARADSEFCYWHDPAMAARRAEANRRGGFNSRQIRHIPNGGPVAIQTPGDLLQVLEDELNHVLQLEPSLARARTVGYLVSHALKAVEIAEIGARLEAVEQMLQNEPARARGNGYGNY